MGKSRFFFSQRKDPPGGGSVLIGLEVFAPAFGVGGEHSVDSLGLQGSPDVLLSFLLGEEGLVLVQGVVVSQALGNNGVGSSHDWFLLLVWFGYADSIPQLQEFVNGVLRDFLNNF
jgi:hypothetical protein